jgi:hypothetical protein
MSVIEQDTARRCLDIIELTGPHDPDEGTDRAAGDHECERKYDVERDHRKALERKELASTAADDSGISSAASSG